MLGFGNGHPFALAAFYNQVAIGHVEAGLRTYDKYSPYPEEMNRKLVSGIADLFFCPTENNRQNLLKEGKGQVLCLIKPQFEAGRENVGKNGVIREPAVHKEVLDSIVQLAKDLGFKILGLTFSPVKGPAGNIEFLGHLTLADVEGIEPDTADVVAQAHKTLD